MRRTLLLAAACLLLAGLALYGSRAVVDESASATAPHRRSPAPTCKPSAARPQTRLLAEHPELPPDLLRAAVTGAVERYPRFAPPYARA